MHMHAYALTRTCGACELSLYSRALGVGSLSREEIHDTFGSKFGVGLNIGMTRDEIDAFADSADLDGEFVTGLVIAIATC